MNWRNQPKSPETRENHRKAALIAMDDPAVRCRIGAKIAASWRDPEIRARRRAGLRAAWQRRLAKQVAA